MSVFVAERRILRIRPKPLNKVEVLTVIAEEKGADDDINRELVLGQALENAWDRPALGTSP